VTHFGMILIWKVNFLCLHQQNGLISCLFFLYLLKS
jgi:hypothetical protein